MGDFNAKVGTEKVDDIVGKHGLGIRNERGEKLIEWCQTNNIIVGNTWFQQPPRRKWTWKSPGDETRNQIDYMMISKRYRNALLLAKTYPSTDCYSDHVPVVGKFKLKLKKNSKPFTNIKFDLAILKTNQTIREKYQISVQNKFEALGDAEEVEQQWENFKSVIMEAATENINNLRYADDTVLIAENKEDLQELNSKKTEVLVISRKQETPKCDIFFNKVKLKQTEKFKYLGTIISNDGKTNREISARTAQAKINFQKMKTILTNKHISIETRKRALQCYIEPVLMYGCEAWTISKQIQNKLEATEMSFLRRMLCIPWTAKKTNERVLNEANKKRSLVRTIRKRQATFLGHVMRRGKLEHLVTTGKFERKRSRGRQREKIMDGLATWLGPGKVSDILAAVKDRDLWRDMIDNAYKQGT
ncbi:craniofacial development protein 2-like protein [Plakobranchus ocellatus]|uniref:Craniofacial development protein 2-like protein n=1 Tax=Plakobranchus ocellatus TaxID=259542 RepID=A0AAV3YQB1_9GAST|nr:craniofacial development protein 2-like protein [Plakobranchus ocellatus]